MNSQGRSKNNPMKRLSGIFGTKKQGAPKDALYGSLENGSSSDGFHASLATGADESTLTLSPPKRHKQLGNNYQAAEGTSTTRRPSATTTQPSTRPSLSNQSSQRSNHSTQSSQKSSNSRTTSSAQQHTNVSRETLLLLATTPVSRKTQNRLAQDKGGDTPQRNGSFRKPRASSPSKAAAQKRRTSNDATNPAQAPQNVAQDKQRLIEQRLKGKALTGSKTTTAGMKPVQKKASKTKTPPPPPSSPPANMMNPRPKPMESPSKAFLFSDVDSLGTPTPPEDHDRPQKNKEAVQANGRTQVDQSSPMKAKSPLKFGRFWKRSKKSSSKSQSKPNAVVRSLLGRSAEHEAEEEIVVFDTASACGLFNVHVAVSAADPNNTNSVLQGKSQMETTSPAKDFYAAQNSMLPDLKEESSYASLHESVKYLQAQLSQSEAKASILQAELKDSMLAAAKKSVLEEDLEKAQASLMEAWKENGTYKASLEDKERTKKQIEAEMLELRTVLAEARAKNEEADRKVEKLEAAHKAALEEVMKELEQLREVTTLQQEALDTQNSTQTENTRTENEVRDLSESLAEASESLPKADNIFDMLENAQKEALEEIESSTKQLDLSEYDASSHDDQSEVNLSPARNKVAQLKESLDELKQNLNNAKIAKSILEQEYQKSLEEAEAKVSESGRPEEKELIRNVTRRMTILEQHDKKSLEELEEKLMETEALVEELRAAVAHANTKCEKAELKLRARDLTVSKMSKRLAQSQAKVSALQEKLDLAEAKVQERMLMQAEETLDQDISRRELIGDADEKLVQQKEQTDNSNEFNPWQFIKALPPYEQVCRHGNTLTAVLPPKGDKDPEKTLVLDLDETLVHCTVEGNGSTSPDITFPVTFHGTTYTLHVQLRPHLKKFLRAMQGLYEVVVFTASQKVYADELLNRLDPDGQLIQHRLFRESCLEVEGDFLKDLNILGRDLSKTVMVDNSPHAFGYQLDNGIPIESWFDDPTDDELVKLGQFLRLQVLPAKDVREVVRKKYQSHAKVAACLS